MSADLRSRVLDATFAVPELPVALKRAAGTLKLRDKALVAEIDGGTIEAGAGGDLTVREGRFAIRELGRNPVIARASLTVEGPLTETTKKLCKRIDDGGEDGSRRHRPIAPSDGGSTAGAPSVSVGRLG